MAMVHSSSAVLKFASEACQSAPDPHSCNAWYDLVDTTDVLTDYTRYLKDETSSLVLKTDKTNTILSQNNRRLGNLTAAVANLSLAHAVFAARVYNLTAEIALNSNATGKLRAEVTSSLAFLNISHASLMEQATKLEAISSKTDARVFDIAAGLANLSSQYHDLAARVDLAAVDISQLSMQGEGGRGGALLSDDLT
jgi:chromosome segregation ATPase